VSLTQRTTSIRLRFRDNDGAESICQCNLASSVSAASAASFLSAWAPLVQALSDAAIVSAEVVIHWTDPARPPAGAGSDVLRQGTFLLDTASSDIGAARVPAISDDFILATGPYAGIGIDTALADVVSLITALTDGIDGTEPCDPFADDFVSINAAYIEQF